jgi:hypothetical protein
MEKKLHLGCGTNIKKDWINLDFVKLKGVEVVHDLNKFPYPFKDNTFGDGFLEFRLYIQIKVCSGFQKMEKQV